MGVRHFSKAFSGNGILSLPQIVKLQVKLMNERIVEWDSCYSEVIRL